MDFSCQRLRFNPQHQVEYKYQNKYPKILPKCLYFLITSYLLSKLREKKCNNLSYGLRCTLEGYIHHFKSFVLLEVWMDCLYRCLVWVWYSEKVCINYGTIHRLGCAWHSKVNSSGQITSTVIKIMQYPEPDFKEMPNLESIWWWVQSRGHHMHQTPPWADQLVHHPWYHKFVSIFCQTTVRDIYMHILQLKGANPTEKVEGVQNHSQQQLGPTYEHHKLMCDSLQASQLKMKWGNLKIKKSGLYKRSYWQRESLIFKHHF